MSEQVLRVHKSPTRAQTHLRYKPEVVANQQQSPLELVDGFSERINRLYVQVVRRFVQEKHVGVLLCQPRKDHTTSLTVREVLDWHHLLQTQRVVSRRTSWVNTGAVFFK